MSTKRECAYIYDYEVKYFRKTINESLKVTLNYEWLIQL